ncbi:hypothetical protein CRUP_030104 [Coryphaenoides rupestris]|nr:hypothetical protein CRUP_030104 [Coryphaenoides rupestris]
MTVHNVYIFDRSGACLHYSEWNRKKQAGISKQELYVDYIVKNPLCCLGETLQSELFSSRLDAFIKNLAYFNPRAA